MNNAQHCDAAPRKEPRTDRSPRVPPARARKSADNETLTEWIRRAKQLPPVRRELVERIKAEIAAGTYETPERLEAAIERLLEDIRGM